MHIKKKIVNSLVAVLALASFGSGVIGCATYQTGVASTVRGKYFQAKVEYANLLVFANEYKASPTADAEVVAKFQEIDLKVQAVEQEINRLMVEGNVSEASQKIDLLIFFVSELRNQLISRGIIKLEDN